MFNFVHMKPSITSYIKFSFQFNTEKLLQDLTIASKNTWILHFNTGGYEGDWKVISLYAPNGEANNIFAHSTENATELVDLVDDGVAVPHVVLAADETDAVGRTHRRAQTTGNALGASVRMNLHDVRATPPGAQFGLLLGVLLRHRFRAQHVAERQGHPLERGPQVGDPPRIRSLYDLRIYRHLIVP